MAFDTLRFKFTGLTPLMMHDDRLANPFNAYARALKAKIKESKKRGGAEEDKLLALVQAARIEWEGGMYYHAKKYGPIMPAKCILGCVKAGAKQEKHGKTVQRGAAVRLPFFQVQYKGPRDLKSLWTAGEPVCPDFVDKAHGPMGSEFVDYRAVKVQSSKVMRCRPIFPEWTIEGEYLYNPRIMARELFASLLELAGAEGIGDGRGIGMGKFEVTVL